MKDTKEHMEKRKGVNTRPVSGDRMHSRWQWVMYLVLAVGCKVHVHSN